MEVYTTCFNGNLTEDTLTSFARMTLSLPETQLDDDQLNCFMLYMVMTLDTDPYRRYKAQRLLQDKMGPDALTKLAEISKSVSDKDLSACHAMLPQYSAFVESVVFESESPMEHAVVSTPLPTSTDPVGACCAASLLVSTHSANIPLRNSATEIAAKELSVSPPLTPATVKTRGYEFLERTSMLFLLTIPQEVYSRCFSEFERYLTCQLTQ